LQKTTAKKSFSSERQKYLNSSKDEEGVAPTIIKETFFEERMMACLGGGGQWGAGVAPTGGVPTGEHLKKVEKNARRNTFGRVFCFCGWVWGFCFGGLFCGVGVSGF